MDMRMRAGVRAGDPGAFAELFDRHARAVYNYGFRGTASWSMAEEVVAMTFLEAWRLRRNVDMVGESLRPWLLGIARNVLRNMTRAARRHQAALARLPIQTASPDFADEVVQRIDDAQAAAELRAALQCLRPGEQDVVAMVAWAGLDQAEAAEALGISVGTVRSRLSRARAKLRARRGAGGAAGGSPRGQGRGRTGQMPTSRARTAQSEQEEAGDGQ